MVDINNLPKLNITKNATAKADAKITQSFKNNLVNKIITS